MKRRLRPGQVYRRSDLSRWTTAVDRHLADLVEDGTLRKVGPGLYSRPRKTPFGEAPPDDRKLVAAFLKDDDFLITTPNAYNSLGVGTTQLSGDTVVYNMKRHDTVELAGRTFRFKRHYRRLPKRLSREFLMVDLADNLKKLGEDEDVVAERLVGRMREAESQVLRAAVTKYGGPKAKALYARAFPARS